jgi:hypothetical protein
VDVVERDVHFEMCLVWLLAVDYCRDSVLYDVLVYVCVCCDVDDFDAVEFEIVYLIVVENCDDLVVGDDFAVDGDLVVGGELVVDVDFAVDVDLAVDCVLAVDCGFGVPIVFVEIGCCWLVRENRKNFEIPKEHCLVVVTMRNVAVHVFAVYSVPMVDDWVDFRVDSTRAEFVCPTTVAGVIWFVTTETVGVVDCPKAAAVAFDFVPFVSNRVDVVVVPK